MSTIEAIKEVLEELASRKNLQSHLDSVLEQIEEEEKQLLILDRTLDKELKDFEDLQKMSVKGLFYKVLGNKEEQVEKERQEYLKVNLKYKEAKESLELLDYEKALIEGKVGDVESLRKQLNDLKVKREAEILQSPSQHRSRLTKVFEDLDNINYLRKEIDEATRAGLEAQAATKIVLSHLNNAIKWGQWDMMNSRSSHYDHMKHSAVDRAMDAAYRSKHIIKVFQKELKDIDNNNYDLQLNVSDSGRFMDIFFDNLISDWIIQNKIKNVKGNVSSVHDKIKLILASLNRDVIKLDEERASLLLKKDQLLIE